VEENGGGKAKINSFDKSISTNEEKLDLLFEKYKYYQEHTLVIQKELS